MILTVTLNPAVDHTVHLENGLTPDAVSRADAAHFDPGGKGINVSKYLLELGTETIATGPVGGFTGRFLGEELAESGVPTDFVQIDGTTRLNTTILAGGEEYKLNQRGPFLDEHVVAALVDTIRAHDPDDVVVAGSLPPGLGPDVIDQIATAGDWRTAVDVGGTTMQDLDAEYAVCKPNRQELAAATGLPVDTLEDCLAAARDLQSRGFECVVASLGADGAVMATPDGDLHAPALDVEVVDSVGAGDALFAGVLAACAEGKSAELALRDGISVAARAVAVPGTSVPRLADVDGEADAVLVSEH